MSNKNPSPATRIKKGEVRNPRGAAAHDPEKRALKSFTKQQYRSMIEAVLKMSVADLERICKDKDQRKNYTPMEFTIMTSILKGIVKGDPTNAELFATRIIGKIPDIIKVDANNLNMNAEVDHDDIKAALAKIESEL